MALLFPHIFPQVQALRHGPSQKPSLWREARLGGRQMRCFLQAALGDTAAEPGRARREPGTEPALQSRRSAMRFALGCGCVAAVQPLIRQPVVPTLEPATWSDPGFASEMGPSLRFYGAARSVVGVEPNLAMHPRARASAEAAGLGDRFSLVAGNAEELPFLDASFDTVVGASRVHERMRA